jgi:hypothetical protein
MPKDALKKVEAEFKKLKLMSPMSAEATVVRNYIDTLVNLPWRKKSKINNDLVNAQKVLDEDHYGLKDIKERILEYLAVRKLRVRTILVLGHAQCGGVAAALTETPDPDDEFIAPWIALLNPARDRCAGHSGDEAPAALEKESIRVSIERLMTFPFVKDAVARGVAVGAGAAGRGADAWTRVSIAVIARVAASRTCRSGSRASVRSAPSCVGPPRRPRPSAAAARTAGLASRSAVASGAAIAGSALAPRASAARVRARKSRLSWSTRTTALRSES